MGPKNLQRFTTPWVVIARAQALGRDFESQWGPLKSSVSTPERAPFSSTLNRNEFSLNARGISTPVAGSGMLS